MRCAPAENAICCVLVAESEQPDPPAGRIVLAAGDEPRILARCRDSLAVSHGKRTARLTLWSDLGRDDGRAWGRCRGSRRYRVWANLETLWTGCDCPSRKRPCKHSVALLLLVARGHVVEAAPPTWVGVRLFGR